MRRIPLLACCALLFCTLSFIGCGYTVLRDFDAEAREAEYAAIDSLTSAPDLAISNIEYEYVPPEPRKSPLDQWGGPGLVKFHLTVTNIGTAEFARPYLLVLRERGPRYGSGGYADMLRNRKEEVLPAGDSLEIMIPATAPRDTTMYEFIILTNSIIQRSVYEQLHRYPPIPDPPLRTREFRFDNNEAHIIVPRMPHPADEGHTRGSYQRHVDATPPALKADPRLNDPDTKWITEPPSNDTTRAEMLDGPGPWEKAFMPIKRVQAVYPEDAKRAGVEGTVWVSFLVSVDSSVSDPKVLRSDAPMLNDAALAAIIQWRFSPAEYGGKPKATRCTVPFRFKLDKQ